CSTGGGGQTCRGRYAVEEAANLPACGADLASCYRVTVGGTGKDVETVAYRVAPAHVTPIIGVITSPPTTDTAPYATVERTQNVTLGVVLGYPGGDRAFRVPLTDDKVPVDAITNGRNLRMVVTRQDFPTPAQVATVPLSYVPAQQRWVGTWTPPRDAPTNGSLVAYRFSLAETRDLWGNRVDARDLANYTLAPATLAIDVVRSFDALPRTDEGDVALAIRYHDGELYTDKTNASPLTGCFVQDAQTTTSCGSAKASERVTLAYEDGLWHARHRDPVDFTPLGAYKFLLTQDNDTWGNTVPGTLALPYQVVVGSPRVSFYTVFQGSTGDPIVRADDTLFLDADITYGDGSAFNNTVVPNPDGHSATLTAYVTKRNLDGVAVSTVPVTLRGESYGPHWSGAMPIRSNNSDSPLGVWTVALDVADNQTTPNVNHTVFNRTVIGAPLDFHEDSAPFDAEIGNHTRMRFSVSRAGIDDSGAIDMGRTLNVLLYRWDPVKRATVGDPVAKLVPPYNPDYHAYAIDYQVPPELFDGTFVFVVRGGDRDGNDLLADAVSHPFRTYASPRERSVVTQPAVSLQRGDEATVVFDGLVGDTGPDGSGDPVVHVDYYNPNTHQWEGKAFDVSSPDAAPNHLGVFPVTIDTNVGVYRFVLEGRQADRHLVTAISQNFTVLPADVSRILFDAPPEGVRKGATFGFSFERQPGDVIFRQTVYFEGRPAEAQPPSLSTDANLFNGSWAVPFSAPAGKYTLRFQGNDRSGNHIDVVLPPIDVLAAQLAGKVIGNPARTVARGAAATVLFGVTYPTGEFYQDPGTPHASVYNASGLVADAAVTRQGLTFQASWTPPAQADATVDYWFEMSGDAGGGNEFPTLQSSHFRLAPGSFERGAAADVPEDNTRGARITYQVPLGDADQFAQFSLEYYGTTRDVSGQVFGTRHPTSVTPLAHTLDPSTGRYVASFITDQQTPPGSYRIVMKGQDKFGNEVVSKSKPFLLRTSSVTVSWDQVLAQGSLQEGKPFTASFVAKYQNGLVMDDTLGKPSVALLVDNKPSRVRPDVSYANGHWVLTWDAPSDLPRGAYIFTVGGTDFSGNQILTSQENAVNYDPSFSQSVAKVVPHLLP